MPFNQILYREYRQNLLFNVSTIGWLGNIMSAVMTVCSALTILHYQAISLILLEVMHMCDKSRKEHMQLFLENFVTCTGTVFYVLSLGNILVSSMLLIGTSRRSCSFMFPWLMYHGLLFGITLHIALYITLSNLFMDLTLFVLSAMILAMGLIIFIKVYKQVFLLFKLLKDEYSLRPVNRLPIMPMPIRMDEVASEPHVRASIV